MSAGTAGTGGYSTSEEQSCVHVCGGSFIFGKHRIACPTCDRETDFLTSFGGVWYGDVLTCLTCGDAWSDGERMERPFRRGWRQESTRRATQKWATALPREEYLAACRAESTAYFDADANGRYSMNDEEQR